MSSELELRYESRKEVLRHAAIRIEEFVRESLFVGDKRLHDVQARVVPFIEFSHTASLYADPLRESPFQLECQLEYSGDGSEVLRALRSSFSVIERCDSALDPQHFQLTMVIPIWAHSHEWSTRTDLPTAFTFHLKLVERNTIPFPQGAQALDRPEKKHVIFLIHGIRTRADWMPMVKRVLEEISGVTVLPIKYGFFDLIKFGLPAWMGFRSVPIEYVRSQIQIAQQREKADQYSVIAHSFGTYAIKEILSDTKNLDLHRLVLCGCIIDRQFAWENLSHRLGSDPINDYGTKDIWPVWAKLLTWGYDDTGRHGFGRVDVKDRGHRYRHCDFFNEPFVQTFWKPWFESNTFVKSTWEEKSPPASWWLNILSIIPLKTVVLLVVLAIAWMAFS